VIGGLFNYINLVEASKFYAANSGSERNRLFLGKKKMAGKKTRCRLSTVDLGRGVLLSYIACACFALLSLGTASVDRVPASVARVTRGANVTWLLFFFIVLHEFFISCFVVVLDVLVTSSREI
jgi:hypothetical protein